VGGGPRAANSGGCSLSDDCQHTFKRRKHLFVREPENHISARREPRIAHFVVLLPRFEVVRFPVKLHDEVRGVTDEVGNVSSHRGLSAERNSIKMMRLEISPQ
jgi:hypothetical protein